jgi:predicted nucleic acid-binding protein
MVVVDANVITHLILKGEHSTACGKLYLADSEWAAPRLWQDEISNVLATYERLGTLTREEGLLAFQDAREILASNTFEVGVERILAVAVKTGCSGYDSQYIALAEDLGLPLYTYDKKVLAAASAVSRRPPA